jgi:hypothetical protein
MGRPRIHANPSDRVRAWRKANPERNAELNRLSVQRWRERNPDRVKANQAAQRTSYGLTLEELDAMWQAQSGRCAICGVPERTTRRLAIDHDHTTGAVRGLLCQRCNMALGMFEDDPDRLTAAAAYLSRQGLPA